MTMMTTMIITEMIKIRKVCTFLLLLIFHYSASAECRYTVMPTRIFLDASESNKEIFVQNNSGYSCLLKVKIIDVSFDDNGKIVKQSNTPNFSSKQFLRISPKSVTLQPYGLQKIKIKNYSENIDAGEYRSYINFSEELSKQNLKNLKLPMSLTLSVPILLKSGETESKAEIQRVSVTKDKGSYKIAVRLKQLGNQSIYGHLLLEGSGNNKRIIKIYDTQEFPFYRSNTLLNKEIVVNQEILKGLRNLTIKYEEMGKENNKILGAKEITL